jgi:hypothetical protein
VEFSHWIPNRILSKSGSRWLRKGFGRSCFNGNYVTPRRHYMHDPLRFPPGHRNFGPRFNPVLRQLDRTPWAVRGAAAGAGAGVAGANSEDWLP